MRERLSIRAYKPLAVSHSHRFHQVVLPVRGAIHISLNGVGGSVGAGHCVIIKKDLPHAFKAREDARFLVADLHDLPASAQTEKTPFGMVSKALRSFCLFADVQLNSSHDEAVEDNMISVFKNLLSSHEFLPEIDRRIARALEYIERDPGQAHSLDKLAAVSTLSVSQLKKLFKRHTGTTVGQYLLTRRMEKAKALLANTDMPIGVIANQAGYSDQSAFSRRFQSYFGASPGQYRER